MITIDLSASRVSDTGVYKERLEWIRDQAEPSFATYSPDLDRLSKLAKKYGTYSHIVVVGRGGSITSTEAFYKNLAWFSSEKRVFFSNSADPDFIAYIKSQCPPAQTLIVSVSKSGTNIEHLENTFAFGDEYHMLIVTSPDENNPLRKAAQIKGWDVVDHPNIGGRFSGMTESTLVPCAIIGLDVEKIVHHMKKAYATYAPSQAFDQNDALKFATHLYALEQQGYDEIFFSLYSVQLNGFAELISQLFHETVCKDEKQGQTVISLLSPESQHHFSQRFYGGKHNMIGVMLTLESYADSTSKTQLPKEIQDIVVGEGRLGDITDITLEQALHCEYEGNKQDATKRQIPLMSISLPDISEESTAGFMAFLQYASVYSAWLRGVDPFTQPHVESSKIGSFEKRREFAAQAAKAAKK